MSDVRRPNWWGLERLGLIGQLDWATGAIRMNCSLEEWQEFIDTLRSGDSSRKGLQFQEIAETLAHELCHLIQICTTGYMYYFCIRLWELLKPSLDPQSQYVHDIRTSPEQLAAVREHIAQLEQPGHHGLTPLDVIEGAAFHFQVSSTWTSPHRRFPQAVYSKQLIYRSAYDKAVKYLGDDDAFLLMPLLVNQSLLYAHPGNAFGDFVRIAAPYVRNRELNWEIFSETSESRLGFAVDVGLEHGQHPFYWGLIERIGEMADVADLVSLFQEPHKAITLDLAMELYPIIILNPVGGKRAVWAPQRLMADRDLVEALVVLTHRAGVVYSRLP